MQTIKYNTSLDSLPTGMKEALKKAQHAGEAEKVFNSFESVCFVPKHERAHVWMQA